MSQNSKILDKLYDYLRLKGYKIPNKIVTTTIIDCPKCKGPAMTLPYFPKIHCNACKVKYDIVECVRLLEKDREKCTNNEILIYLSDLFKMKYVSNENLTEVLDFYYENNFDLLPVRVNSKVPVEREWTTKNHTEMIKWRDWLRTNNNLGVKTGRMSNITVIDFDGLGNDEKDEIRNNTATEERKNELLTKKEKNIKSLEDEIGDWKDITMTAYNLGGYHLFFQYEEDIRKTAIDVGSGHIDIENDGGYVLLYPSTLNSDVRECPKLKPIIKMPDKLKQFLLSKNAGKVKITNPNETLENDIKTENFNLDLIEEGNRHNVFMHLGGVLRKKLNAQNTEFVLNILNKHLCKPPLPRREFINVIGSLDKYINVDEKDLADKIIKYLRMVEEATSRDLKEIVGESKERVDSALSYLVKESYILKRGKGNSKYYQILKHANWKDTFPPDTNSLGFEIPFFNKTARLCWGDMILLGSRAKWGKTTISVNFLKSFIEQDIKPYYISLEAGSRFIDTARVLGINEGDFWWDFQSDATKIELEPNAVTIIDWLMIEDKSQTDNIMKHFIEQLYKTNGFLIIFQQLKVSGEWFAPNMVNQFPSMSARYLYDDETDGTYGRWEIDVIREPLANAKTAQILCVYNQEERRLNIKEQGWKDM